MKKMATVVAKHTPNKQLWIINMVSSTSPPWNLMPVDLCLAAYAWTLQMPRLPLFGDGVSCLNPTICIISGEVALG